jgi:hypothetical protein
MAVAANGIFPRKMICKWWAHVDDQCQAMSSHDSDVHRSPFLPEIRLGFFQQLAVEVLLAVMCSNTSYDVWERWTP